LLPMLLVFIGLRGTSSRDECGGVVTLGAAGLGAAIAGWYQWQPSLLAALRAVQFAQLFPRIDASPIPAFHRAKLCHYFAQARGIEFFKMGDGKAHQLPRASFVARPATIAREA